MIDVVLNSGILTLEDLLQEQQSTLSIENMDDEDVQLIVVRRGSVWMDVKRLFAKPYVNLRRIWKVGEEGQDGGGLRREFFRIALSSIFNDPVLFRGNAHKVPTNDSRAIMRKEFLFVGYIISSSIVQGGSGPECFPEWIFQYFCGGIESCLLHVDGCIDCADCIESNVRKWISKVKS